MAAAGLALAIAPIAESILKGVVTHYQQAAGVELPKRRVIAPGAARGIAWDGCEQVVVTLVGVGLGSAPGEGAGPKAAGNPVSAMGLRHAVFAVQITRQTPESENGLKPPPDDELTKAALAVIRDAGLLSQALVEVCTTVAATLPRGSRVQPGAVEVLGPDGGFCAVEGTIAVTAGLLA